MKLYRNWHKDFPYDGLCEAMMINRLLDGFTIFEPTISNKVSLEKEGKSSLYWGSDDKSHKRYEFTTLRQNIVLLMAAMYE